MKSLPYIAITLGCAGATAFLDYLVNNNGPLSKPVLIHAGLAAGLTVLALAKQSFLTPPVQK